MRILTGERPSDRLITKMAAESLGIPETEEDLPEVVASEDLKDLLIKKAAKNCPDCGSEMRVEGSMNRCGCGYACSASLASDGTVKHAEEKTPGETSITEYYSKIYPKDYVNDLKATGPVTPKGGEKVQYGHVPVDKKVSGRALSAKDLRKSAEGYDGAGRTEVKDAHPESGLSAGSAGEKTPEPKNQGSPSANSVEGPEVANSLGTGLADPDSVSMPDIGVPGKAAGRDPWVTRQQMASICPSCADEMARRGIKRVRASVIARQLVAAMNSANLKVRG